MRRQGYTLIEIIITIAITGILAIGMFKAFEAITLRSEKTKVLSILSLDSQSALDQISALLYNRSPMSVSGYNLGDPSRTPLESSVDKHIIEWYGLASESYTSGDYSTFIDMNRSNHALSTLYSPDTNASAIAVTQNQKWGSFAWSQLALIFSGTFDEGHAATYPISMVSNNLIVFTAAVPDTIFEKYNLVDSAYAVARGADIDKTAPCIASLGVPASALNDTLLLFYDYRPWNTQSFCADNANRSGKVAVLSANVSAFRAQMLNGTIRFSLDMRSSVRGSSMPVHLAKQKVVF